MAKRGRPGPRGRRSAWSVRVLLLVFLVRLLAPQSPFWDPVENPEKTSIGVQDGLGKDF